jgi:alpha-N-dichloroacetyl-p-aminophenylserinol N-oxygenase
MATSALTDATALERDLLALITRRWGRRVAVKKDELDLDGHFEPGRPDFPAKMVPVFGLPGQFPVDRDARQQILAASWIAYNAKTKAVEEEIILPACRLMLAGRVPVRTDEVAVAALHQTIIDEHFHILMCDNAAGVTRRRRGLDGLAFDPGSWSVVRGLNQCRAGLTGTARDIVDVAFSLAAETTISLLFTTIASDLEIQPMNRITVDMHQRDESGHAVIFRELIGPLYRAYGHSERELFKAALLQGLTAFRRPDFGNWVAVAAAGGLDISAGQLAEAAAARPSPPRDTGPLRVLLTQLGLTGEFRAALRGGGPGASERREERNGA